MKLTVDIQSATSAPVPDARQIRRWLSAALNDRVGRDAAEVSVRLVDNEEMSRLNESYRGKAGPTNVLSFPADLPAELQLPLLGDIVICAPLVGAEAAAQGKDPEAHWAHLTVHGALHLLGYDHIEEAQAIAMEQLETAILGSLHYRCPYDGAEQGGIAL